MLAVHFGHASWVQLFLSLNKWDIVDVTLFLLSEDIVSVSVDSMLVF
jgi:hypothetical protein